MQRIFILFNFLLLSLPLLAQTERVTEEEVQLQAVFIEGNREKLLGNYEKAIVIFEKVLEKDIRNGAVYYEIARLYDVQEQLDDAIKNAKKAVEYDASNDWYHLFLADLYLKNNQDPDAAGIFENLVQRSPSEDDYYYKWAYFLVRSGEPSKAVDVYNKLEQRIGINEETVRRKHSLYLGMGDYKSAQKELENLINAFPQNIGFRLLLANFFQQQNDANAAQGVYKDILKIDPNNTEAKIALAQGNRKSDGKEEYLAQLKEVFQNPNIHIDVKITEIMPLVAKVVETNDQEVGKDALALAYILEEVHPGQAKSYSIIGDLLYHTNQKNKAAEYYLKTIKEDENVYLVWEQLLYIYAENEDYDNLVEQSENALDLFPNQGTIYYLNGLGYNGLKQYNNAVNSLQQALIIASKNPRITFQSHLQLGKAYHHLKKAERSNKSFEQALAMNDKDPIALDMYAAALSARSEKLARAKELLTKAMKNGGNNNALVLEHYGDVLFQLNDTDKAVEYWQKALENGSKSSTIEKKIAERKLY